VTPAFKEHLEACAVRAGMSLSSWAAISLQVVTEFSGDAIAVQPRGPYRRRVAKNG
jgi:hypothetical protein